VQVVVVDTDTNEDDEHTNNNNNNKNLQKKYIIEFQISGLTLKMSTKKLLNARAREILTSYLVNKSPSFAVARSATNQTNQEAQTLSNQIQSRQLHCQNHHSNKENKHLYQSNTGLNKCQIRLTSTTPPAASSGHIAPVAAIPKREASTQAKRQQQLLEALEPQSHVTSGSLQQIQVDNEPIYFGETFKASDLVTLECAPAEMKPKPSVEQLLFGHYFTDHMFQVEWNNEKGWSTPLITKMHNLEIHPGSKVLHYAVQAFEGAKAYRGYDNRIRFFRLDANIKRLLRSSRRLALPDFDENELMRCIHRLVHLDQDWIPELNPGQPMTSLYIRPTILGIEPSLGVASSRRSLLYVLLSPVGPYFKTGFKAVTLYADPDFVRAWPGGAGHNKLGSNYAPTIMIQKQAEKLGLQQVLWLYGDDMKLTEVGTMNIFVSIKNPATGKIHLVTPPLDDGIILPGITRDSILKLASQWEDVICEERYVTIGELKQLIHDKNLIEVFGAGTACIVCPINGIHMKDGTKIRIPYTDITKCDEPTFGREQSEFLTKRLLKAISDIQYGRIPHPWAQDLLEQ
jgi:branched-chain amino acid aminotransferase